MPLERKISNHTQNQKKKKGEEGVIRERVLTSQEDLCVETKPDYPGLEFPPQHQSVYKWQP